MTRDEWDDYLMSSGMSIDDCLTSAESRWIEDLDESEWDCVR